VRVLNLSLDLFVDPIAVWAGLPPNRLPDDRFRAWNPDLLRRFLEERCGLRKEAPVPGRIVESHEGALGVWREWIGEGELETPFDLVHMDAHANLGSGDEGWFYVLTELLALPASRRQEHADLARVMPENYLLFAIAFRWIRDMTFVAHHTWTPDVLDILYEEHGAGGVGTIRLGRYDRLLLGPALEMGAELPSPLALDPPLPLRVHGPGDYHETDPFDRIVVSRSPSYTPPEADGLLDTVTEYMNLV
jgi:hypothetical protein